MLAGLLLFSICGGAIATAAALALALPTWMALLAYPLAGMVTFLLFGGALAGRLDLGGEAIETDRMPGRS